MIRSQLAELGIVLAKGIHHALRLVDQLVEGVVPDIPPLACKIVIALAEQIRALQARVAMIEGEIKTWFRGNDLAKRLATIPGIGYITASALAASVTDPHRFTSARQFAASLGLTPKADSSAGKDRMGRISTMGDRYSRLIRADEEGTLAALKVLRTDVIDPKIAEHYGRIVKLMGDDILVEFASVVDAVHAAVQTQQALSDHNADMDTWTASARRAWSTSLGSRTSINIASPSATQRWAVSDEMSVG
ncbi:MAG: transposase, partial [Alphaproteobacteria bacterium]